MQSWIWRIALIMIAGILLFELQRPSEKTESPAFSLAGQEDQIKPQNLP